MYQFNVTLIFSPDHRPTHPEPHPAPRLTSNYPLPRAHTSPASPRWRPHLSLVGLPRRCAHRCHRRRHRRGQHRRHGRPRCRSCHTCSRTRRRPAHRRPHRQRLGHRRPHPNQQRWSARHLALRLRFSRRSNHGHAPNQRTQWPTAQPRTQTHHRWSHREHNS